MKVIVGLGNPGKTYEHTRHNVGFKVIDELAKRFKVEFKKKRKYFSLIGEETASADKIWLMKPQTYMNLSGSAVLSVVKNTNIGLENLLIISDDINLELGRIRIREKGTSGGHNGLNSIIEYFAGDKEFPRLRIGVGYNEQIPAEKYVLGKFLPVERKEIEEIVKKAADVVEYFLREGIDKTMNKYNR
ncbi:aminoacyl-tRNA hydrolase [Candidatus Auribacterota bacterium]